MLKKGENVLDVACGTGIVARMASDLVGTKSKVAGVDINTGMLNIARTKFSKPYDAIEWIEADAMTIPLNDAEFDVAFCQQGLQFFPDKVKALNEIRRVLKPKGRCIVCVARGLEFNPLMQSQSKAFARHISEEAAQAIRVVCALSDPDVLHKLFTDSGFSNIHIESVELMLAHENGREFVTGGIGSTPVADLISDWDDNARNDLFNDILSGFGEYYDGQSLAFPHVSHVVEAVNL